MARLSRVLAQHVDIETGEVASKKQMTREEFVMLYVGTLTKMLTTITIPSDVLIGLLRYMDKEQIIALTTSRKKKLAEALGVTIGHISDVLSRLCKANVFRRVDRGEYYVNPYCFSKVSWTELGYLRMQFDRQVVDSDGNVTKHSIKIESKGNEPVKISESQNENI